MRKKDMTEQQQKAVKNAAQAFVAALDAGVDEDKLIDAVFDASNKWFVASLKSDEKKQDGARQEKYLVSK